MKLLLGLLLSAAAWSQPLTVYSDLAEIDPTGRVTAPDTPREILSPAVVRNGFTSFQVVVQAPADAKWWLFIGQNPENSFKLTLYRESGDALEPVNLPRQGSGTEVFWMDLWTDANAPVQRVKVEPQLLLDGDWTIYPIEARVMEAKAPDMPPFAVAASVHVNLERDCAVLFANPVGNEALTVRRQRSRNFEQDIRLAEAHSAMEEVKKLNQACDFIPSKDPEHFLPIRDYLYRLR